MAAAPAASLACDLDTKFFKGVLNGLTKKAVFADPAVTHALIADNLFAGSALDRPGALLRAGAVGGRWWWGGWQCFTCTRACGWLHRRAAGGWAGESDTAA